MNRWTDRHDFVGSSAKVEVQYEERQLIRSVPVKSDEYERKNQQVFQ